MKKVLLQEYQVPAIVNRKHEVSYEEMLQRISLYSQAGFVKAGARSILFCENREGWIYAYFSIWHKAGIIVPVDEKSSAEDLAYIIKDCQPSSIWTSHSHLKVAAKAMELAKADLKVCLVEDLERTDIPEGTEKARIEYESADTAVIAYTSGTTSVAKGVMLSFGNLLANLNSIAKRLPINPALMRSIILLPLHHTLPMQGSLLIPLILGSGLSICPSLLGPDIIDTLQRKDIGIAVGVPVLWTAIIRIIKTKVFAQRFGPTMFRICRVLQWRWLSRRVFHSVHELLGEHLYVITGGAAFDYETALDAKALGLDLMEGYGMTETSPIISLPTVDDLYPGAVGPPLPDVEVIIKDEEICVKGPNVMQGYYNRPEETASVFDEEGWLHTGDKGYFDRKGRLHISGRIKELIILSNGKNVNPLEIEQKLMAASAIVKDVAVTEKNDVLHAIVIPQESWLEAHQGEDAETIIRKELIKPYNKEAAPHKRILSLTIHHGELPRNRMGKLQRYKLADMANLYN